MNPFALYAIVFIEGFSSLGAEIIALRRLTPNVGSSILVTAPTIGFFLLALAAGYYSGAKVDRGYINKVTTNFLMSAGLIGGGLSLVTIDFIFAAFPALVAYLVFVLGILCPIAWLLGQTVPILTNLVAHERAGQASGTALFWSTIGSFAGSIIPSLILMQFAGISWAIMACSAALLAGVLIMSSDRSAIYSPILLFAAIASVNMGHSPNIETAFGQYRVDEIIASPSNGYYAKGGRVFIVNSQNASFIGNGDTPLYASYIGEIRKTLIEDLALKGGEVLVLGAGGFTLSIDENRNRYTYVDIDPAIRKIAENHFLHKEINGDFKVDDARNYTKNTERKFDAVVVDVYSSHTSIPSHLVTKEFWASTRRILLEDGVMIANLILDGRLESPYSRNILATIESIYGRCSVDVLRRKAQSSNVEVVCFATSTPGDVRIYTDESNRAELDRVTPR